MTNLMGEVKSEPKELGMRGDLALAELKDHPKDEFGAPSSETQDSLRSPNLAGFVRTPSPKAARAGERYPHSS